MGPTLDIREKRRRSKAQLKAEARLLTMPHSPQGCPTHKNT